MNIKISEVPLSYINEPERPVRSFLDEEKFNELVESIKENGVLEPIICQDRGNKLEIIAGHRRFMAAKVAGLTTVPCVVRKVSQDEIEKIKLHENYGREEISPIDEANFFHEYMTKHNLNIHQMCEKIHKSRAYVERRLSILSLHPALLEAVQDGIVSISSALVLNEIDNENEIKRSIEYAQINGCTEKTAKLWLQQWETTKTAIDHTQKYEPSEESENAPTGKILWTCFICDAPKNATETYTVPLCEECRTQVLRAKETKNQNMEEIEQ